MDSKLATAFHWLKDFCINSQLFAVYLHSKPINILCSETDKNVHKTFFKNSSILTEHLKGHVYFLKIGHTLKTGLSCYSCHDHVFIPSKCKLTSVEYFPLLCGLNIQMQVNMFIISNLKLGKLWFTRRLIAFGLWTIECVQVHFAL